MSENDESKVMHFAGEEDCVLSMIQNRVAEGEAVEVDVPEETNNIEVKKLNIDDLRRMFQEAE